MSQQSGEKFSFEFDEAKGIYVISSDVGVQITTDVPITNAKGELLVPASEQNNVTAVATNTPEVGQLVKGEGVYLGYHPICYDNGDPVRNGDGEIIRHHFFASPEDLKDENSKKMVVGFNAAAKAIGGLKAHYGYDGQEFANNHDFVKKLAEGDYDGQWRAPSKDILDKLHDAKYTGEFNGSFDESVSDPAGWYGSSSEVSGHPNGSWQQKFDGGDRGWYPKSVHSSWRPVRSKPSLEA